MCSADWWEGLPDDCCFVSVSTISTKAWAGKLKTGSRKLETGITLPSTLPTKWNGFVRRKWSLSETKNGICFSDEPRAGRPGIQACWEQGLHSSLSRTASGPNKSLLQRVPRGGIEATGVRSYLRPSSAEIKNVPGYTSNPTWLLSLPLNYVVTGMWRRIAKNKDKWVLFWIWCRVILYTGTYVSAETATSFFKVKYSYKRSVHTYKSSIRARGCFARDKAARAWS